MKIIQSLLQILPYSKFFEKWFRHTRETTTVVFASNHPKAQRHYGQAIELLEQAIYFCDGDVSTAQLLSHREFRLIVDPLIKAHTAYAEAGLFSFALKLFRQSLIEVVMETEIEDKFQMVSNIGKTFDAIDLITAEIYHIDGMSQLKNKLYELAKTKSESSANTKMALGALTQTEHMVCELISSGCSTKEIADRMNIVESTVQTHRKNIRKKLSLTEKQNLYSYLKYSEA